MNNGAFGENFPYSNFHDLNMDWIIKIAKDFLDQYTHIQEIIANGETSLTGLTEEGLQELTDKKEELEDLLDQWYENANEELASQLASALQTLTVRLTTYETQFEQTANALAQSAIESIPQDYTDLSNTVQDMIDTGYYPRVNIAHPDTLKSGFWSGNVGDTAQISSHAYDWCLVVPVETGKKYTCSQTNHWSMELDDDNKILKRVGPTTSVFNHTIEITEATTTKLAITFNSNRITKDEYMVMEGETLPLEYAPYDAVSMRRPLQLESEYIGAGHTSRNLAKPSLFVDGKFKSGQVGSEISETENSQFAYIQIPTLGKTKFIVSGTDFYWYTTNTLNVILQRGGDPSANLSKVVIEPTYDAVNLVVNFKPSHHPIETYMIMEGDYMPTGFEPYGAYIFNDNSETAIKNIVNNMEEVYYVGANREYTTFYGLLTALASNTNPKIIYVDAGTYDLFSELGGAEYCSDIPANASWRNYGVFIPANTKIIGIGNVQFNFTPTLEQVGNGLNILSPISITSDNVYIENIRIDASNCRYAIHDERNSNGTDMTTRHYRTFKNVYAYKHGSGYPQCLGGGIAENTDYLFDNCVFKSSLSSFSYHSNNIQGGNHSTLAIKNCVLYSTSTGDSVYALRFGNVSARNEVIDVFVNNCLIHGQVKIGLESGMTTGKQNFKVVFIKSGISESDIIWTLADGDTNDNPAECYN